MRYYSPELMKLYKERRELERRIAKEVRKLEIEESKLEQRRVFTMIGRRKRKESN